MTATARKADQPVQARTKTVSDKGATVVIMAKRPNRKFNLEPMLVAVCRNVLPPLVVLVALLAV